MSLKVDLHCHSNESDGSLSCEELLTRAAENNVNILAITDHDTTAAHSQASKLASQSSVQIIPGVEISAAVDNQELHIVGLGIDIGNEALQQLLEQNRANRKLRAVRILEKIRKAGFEDLSEPLQDLLKGDVVCRSHLAQLLCEQGIVQDFQRAFKKYLGKKGKAWVPAKWQQMELVVDRIKQAGGVAVLAHPTKYKLSHTRLGLIIEAFKNAGGSALEIAYPGLNLSDRAMLIRHIERHQLSVSQGSDFHHPGTTWTELGAFAINPASFNAVWQQYELAIHTG